MKKELSEKQIERMAQFLTTEHFTLQGERGATITEANGRLGQYISIVGSGVVALAFVANVSDLGALFFAFSLIILPVMIILGFVTLVRTMQIAVDYVRIVQAINRIRNFYLEITPEAEPYFSFPKYDDQPSVMMSMMPFHSRFQGLASTPGPVILINSVLVGALSGILVASIFSAGFTIGLISALIGLILAFFLHMVYTERVWEKAGQQKVEVRFPKPED